MPAAPFTTRKDKRKMKKYTDQEFEKTREHFDEIDDEIAPEEVRAALDSLYDALEVYMSAVSSFEFQRGFRCAEMLRENNKNANKC